MSKKIKITKEQLINAFEAWELFTRTNPQDCVTDQEVKDENLREAAIWHADTLIRYIEETK